MKKLERQKKAKKLAHAEEVERMKQIAAEKGQGFVENELPPDEVDEDQVKRSLYTSFMTFIPYTNEYYEAMAAEEEMDDLGKIRIEKVKANDLYAKTKIGRHEEALESMMAETNYDFFYFNKLKMKMEEEGRFKFQMPDNKSLFAALDSGPNRNRLRKAINQVYNALDEKMTDELRRMGQVSSAGRAAAATKDYDGEEPCVWRGKNKNGEAMKCDNHRFERPSVVDPANPTRKKKKEFFQYCCYHVPFCISDLHELGQSIKIKVPNNQALCAECFMLKNKRRPAPLTSDSAPGVVPVTLINAKNLVKLTKGEGGGDSDEEKAKEKARKKKMKKVKAANPNVCPWQPTPEELNIEPALRKYECCNDRHKNEATQFQYPHCVWHLRNCIRDHSNDETAMGIITVPNMYGLCMMHYLAEHQDKPPTPPFPFPGMKFRRKKDFWKHDPLHSHWALPRTAQIPHSYRVPPLPDVFLRSYEPPEPPENFIQQSALWVKIQVYKRRLRKEGKRAALVIQKYFRGYRVRNMSIDLVRKIDEREIKARLFNSILIQSQMRRYLAVKHVLELRARYNQGAKDIQRVYRGSVVRTLMRRLRAAKRIKRFMKRLHFFKFRDAVILIMSIRRMFRKRNTTAMNVQRFYRGYRGRVFVFYQRLWKIITKSMQRVVQRALRLFIKRYAEWKKRQRKWTRPTEEALRGRLVKRLGKMLTLFLQQQRARRLQKEEFVQAMQPMQALARGYLARIGMSNLRTLRKQLTNWVTNTKEDGDGNTGPRPQTSTLNAMELVMKMVQQHRMVNYKIPPHIYVTKATKQTALLTYKHRQNSILTTTSTITANTADSHMLMLTKDYADEEDTNNDGASNTMSQEIAKVEAGREFWFIRKYVQAPFCYWPEIDKKKHFLPALHRWYQEDQHLSLMTSEQQALISRFTNRVNNKIMVEVLDMYIAQHPLPCRKHGRRVCGTCFYRRHCLLPSCHCQCYSNQQPPKKLLSTTTGTTSDSATLATEDGNKSVATAEISLPSVTSHHLGICVQCDHPINMHAICPLQYPKPFTTAASSSIKRGRQKNPTAELEAQLEFLDEEEVLEQLRLLREAKTAQALSVAPQRVDPSGASVGTMLDIVRTVNDPDMSMPIGVYGVNASDVVIPALTYVDERMYNESIADRQARRLQRILRGHFTGKAAQKATAKTTKGSALEKQLKEQGILVALQSPVIQALSSTIKLQQTLYNQEMGLSTLGFDSDTANSMAEEIVHATQSLLQGKSANLLVKELATMQLEGDAVALNNTYWEEDVMPSAIRMSTENTAPKTHHQDFLQVVVTDSHLPEPRNPEWAKPDNPRFWEEVVAKNPNKSATDYNEGFEHNMPVPLLLPPKHRVGDQKELVYTFEGGKLYYNILWQIIQLAESVETQFSDHDDPSHTKGKSSSMTATFASSQRKRSMKKKNLSLHDVINPDYPPFLSLVMNHIQIFERHWRKMVGDMRTGTLDRRLFGQGSISKNAKTAFEATQIPRPALAEQLDECFRALGFHKKVLGKDIEIKPLAGKKTVADRRRILEKVELDGRRLRGEVDEEEGEYAGHEGDRKRQLVSSETRFSTSSQGNHIHSGGNRPDSRLVTSSSHGHSRSGEASSRGVPLVSSSLDSASMSKPLLKPLVGSTSSPSNKNSSKAMNHSKNTPAASKTHTSAAVHGKTSTNSTEAIVVAAKQLDYHGSSSSPEHKHVVDDNNNNNNIPRLSSSSSPQRRRRSLPIAVEADTASRPVTALLTASLSPRLLPPLSATTKHSSQTAASVQFAGTAETFSPPGSPLDRTAGGGSSSSSSSRHRQSSSPPKSASSKNLSQQRDLFLKSLTESSKTSAAAQTHNAHHKQTHQEELFANAVTVFEPDNAAERTLLRSQPALLSGSRKRRKSASQVHITASTELNEEQVHAIHYDLITDARDKQAYESLVRLASTGRFLCPFPACGVTFLTAEVGFMHLKEVHGQQTRLYASTPQTDAMMRFYWPKNTGEFEDKEGNPWQMHAKKDNHPPGSIVCPVSTCRGQTFATRSKWETHLRIVHHIYHLSHEKQSYWSHEDHTINEIHHAHTSGSGGDDQLVVTKSSRPSTADAQQTNDVDDEAFHVTAAMQQQTFHRHGGARVLKTIPPDHSQPLFDNDAEIHEFEMMVHTFGEDVFARPLLVPILSDSNAHSSVKTHSTGKSSSSSVTKKDTNKLAALKHRATHGFASKSRTSGNGHMLALSNHDHASISYTSLVQILRQDRRYYAGIGARKILPSFCLTHAASSSHCLACLHSDADYDSHRDVLATAQQLRERSQQLQDLSSRGHSLYYVRPHAPYQIQYAISVHLHLLARMIQKVGLSTLPATISTIVNAKQKKTLPVLLRHALPVTTTLHLLHGDDQHVLLIQRDLYSEHGVDILSAMPPALRPKPPAPAGVSQKSTAHTTATATAATAHNSHAHSHSAEEEEQRGSAAASYRLQNASLWPPHFLVRPVFLIQDRDKLAWIGCEPVFLPAQLQHGDSFDLLNLTISSSSDTHSNNSTTSQKVNAHHDDDGDDHCIRIFDRDNGQDLTSLLSSSANHELLTATALLSHYDTRLPEIHTMNAAANGSKSCVGICALLSSPERLVWLPLHCVAAAFKVSYVPAPARPDVAPSSQLSVSLSHLLTQPDKTAAATASSASSVGGDSTSTVSSYHAKLAAEEAEEAEEMMTPLARWKIRQEAILQLLSMSSSSTSAAANSQQEQQQQQQLVPALKDIAPARFFVRI